MRGTITRLFENGVQLEVNKGKNVATGDFNLRDGVHPVSGRLTRQAFVTEPGHGVVGQLQQVEVIAVAGFGMQISGFEVVKLGGKAVEVRQEWWFVPTGHEENE